ncbi:MAG: hypothetical protein EA426_08810 [Spirochaetaceae bacterium]|nr:MAG: hypothetical protein EA426_08810 [Spirochaetaceae bacterium]
MGINKRFDGIRLRKLPPFRIINPHVMRGRNEAAVYFEQDIDVSATREFVRRLNEGEDKENVTFFHVVLAALVRVLVMRPQLNRFVSGRYLYQRNRIQLSFIVKKTMTETAAETNAKITYDATDTLYDVVEKTDQKIAEARDPAGNENDREMEFFSRFPRSIVSLVIRLFKILDYWGIAPRHMIDIDPLYASIYIANLASLGLDAPYHHLYEWGNASVFVVVGRHRKKPVVGSDGTVVVKDIVTMRYTFDDRISEGIYCARAIELFKRLVEKPELLLTAPTLTPDMIAELKLLPA